MPLDLATAAGAASVDGAKIMFYCGPTFFSKTALLPTWLPFSRGYLSGEFPPFILGELKPANKHCTCLVVHTSPLELATDWAV